MNFETVTIPLSAPTGNPSHHTSGIGFVIQVNGQFYLVTSAHLATGTTPVTDNWSLWADELLVWDAKGQPSEKLPLFDVYDEGARQPKFKFVRAFDTPEVLVDAILLPLASDSHVAGRTIAFILPASAAACQIGEVLTTAGYFQEPGWPSLAASAHTVTGAQLPIFSVNPAPLKGTSGGPVDNSQGQLVGLGYGSGNAHATSDDDGLVIPVQVILAAESAVDGRIISP